MVTGTLPTTLGTPSHACPAGVYLLPACCWVQGQCRVGHGAPTRAIHATESEGALKTVYYGTQIRRVLGQYLKEAILPYRRDSSFTRFDPYMLLTVLWV